MQEVNRFSPLIEKGTKRELSRRFLGNLFPKTPLEHKELKAYIKGYDSFFYGVDFDKNKILRKVRQEYFYI